MQVPTICRIEKTTIIKVTGKHATQYLHNRLSNNIRSLRVGEGQSACALSPHGKIEGLFHVVKEGEDSFLVSSFSRDSESNLVCLKAFLISERVEFVDCCSDFNLYLQSSSPFNGGEQILDIERFQVQHTDSGMELPIATDLDLILTPRSKMTAPQTLRSCEEMRFTRPLPSFGLDTDLSLLPQECGLLNAISFNKGCYVGQEVIAKIDALGKAPRRLVLIEITCEPNLPISPIIYHQNDTKQIGKLFTSSFQSGDRRMIFGTIRASETIENNTVLIESTGKVMIPGKILWPPHNRDIVTGTD